MKIAKRFRWEGAHRLPWHQGLCRNLHGHSYTMIVEVEGELDDHGLLMDFRDLKNCLKGLIERWDHALMIAENDPELIEVAQGHSWKHAILPYDTTAENICRFAADHLVEHFADVLRAHRVRGLTVRVSETETSYAEYSRPLALTSD